MEADLHDLTAGYALDALEPDEARAYEEHLARCERCRAELATLSETASVLAYATEAPAPPQGLRMRILDQAGRERSNVVPLRPKWTRPLAAVAAVAACAALGLGLWAAALSGELDRAERDLTRQEQVARILARPDSRQVPFSGGTLVVTRSGEAALVLRNLDDPGSGRTYEAWVADGGAPQPAGLFGGGDVVAVPLERAVRAGAVVLVTEEPAGGRQTPSGRPFLTVRSGTQS